MHSIESLILSYLLNSLWQIPLLLATGYVAARALKPVGAAAEHRVWVSVLLLQTLLPACSWLPSTWVRALFVWGGDAHRVGDSHVSVVMGAGTGFGALHLPPALLTAIAIAYLAVCAYFAGRFVWRWGKLNAMRREAMKIELSGEASLYWAQCMRRFEIDDVSIATSSRVCGPVTIGLAQKLLLLPSDMVDRLPGADLRTVIAHEFAHMRRNDFLKNLIYEVFFLPASYHPALWLTRERIMETREIVCDEMAAEITGQTEYARSLLRLASLLVSGMPIRTPHAIGIFDANAFERRLMKLTEKQNEVHGMRRFAIVAACVAFGVATCGSALALRMSVDAMPAGNDIHASQPSSSLTVPASEMAGNKLTGPNPKYPDAAKKARIQGAVMLDAVIGKDGSVEKLTVVSGPKELQQSSLDAVQQWTYKPYLVNGQPVEIKTTINVIYSLAK